MMPTQTTPRSMLNEIVDPRIARLLFGHGIETVADLRMYSTAGLLSYPDITNTTLMELQDQLARKGIRF